MIENFERDFFADQLGKRHDSVIKRCRPLKRQKFMHDGVDFKMSAEAAQHHVAGVTEREQYFGGWKQFADERQLCRVHRMLVHEHFAVAADPMAAHPRPIIRA